MRFRFTKTSLTISAAALLVTVAGAAYAVGADQSTLVSPTPATTTPNINNGNIYSIVQIGTRIIVGGDFSNANPPGDTNSAHAVTRNSILAFSAATGQIDTGFAPALNGQVKSLIPGPSADTVYVGGFFSTVNGVASKGLTLLSTVTGQIVPGFAPSSIAGGVWAIQHVGTRLIIAGQFTAVGGVTHDGIAAVNATTGAVDNAYINVQYTGHHNYNGTSGANGAVGPHEMDLSPDGTRLVVIGNFKNANGALHDQITMIDVGASSAVLDPNWNTAGYSATCSSSAYDTYMRGVSFSPDGSYFVVVATGGGTTTHNTDGTRALCDTAARWTTTDTGTNVKPVWIDYSGNDSFESVTITTTAIYAGGHFRWVNNSNCSDSAGSGAVPRPGIAALDPANGMPYAWNPGRNPRGAGAYTVYTTPNGLYVGGDTDFIGTGATYTERNRISFFPLAGGEAVPTYVPAALPANIYLAGKTSGTSPDILSQVAVHRHVDEPQDDRTDLGYCLVERPGCVHGRQQAVLRLQRRQALRCQLRRYDGRGGQPGRPVRRSDLVERRHRLRADVPWQGADALRHRDDDGPGHDPDERPPLLLGRRADRAALPLLRAGRRHRRFGRVHGQRRYGQLREHRRHVHLRLDSSTTPTRPIGNLHSVAWNNGAPTAASDTVVSGPGIDGIDWRTRGMFALTATISQPTASFTSSCTDLTCTFDASASTAPGSTITSYDWDFGDGTQGSGADAEPPVRRCGHVQRQADRDDRAGDPGDEDAVRVAESARRYADLVRGVGADQRERRHRDGDRSGRCRGRRRHAARRVGRLGEPADRSGRMDARRPIADRYHVDHLGGLQQGGHRR